MSLSASGNAEKNPDPRQKIFFFKQFFFKIPKLKIYYAKWTLRIEVVNGNKIICFCIFGVYLVTGTKNPDISEKGSFQISKIIFYITTRGTLKDCKTRFLRLLMKC
jgi:hypothetical protein